MGWESALFAGSSEKYYEYSSSGVSAELMTKTVQAFQTDFGMYGRRNQTKQTFLVITFTIDFCSFLKDADFN